MFLSKSPFGYYYIWFLDQRGKRKKSRRAASAKGTLCDFLNTLGKKIMSANTRLDTCVYGPLSTYEACSNVLAVKKLFEVRGFTSAQRMSGWMLCIMASHLGFS
jgi:hypothetical protein